MYTVQQLATRYAVGPHTVLRWIHAGELKAVNVNRGGPGKPPQWRISPEALAAFEAARTAAPAQAPRPRRKRQREVVAIYAWLKLSLTTFAPGCGLHLVQQNTRRGAGLLSANASRKTHLAVALKGISPRRYHGAGGFPVTSGHFCDAQRSRACRAIRGQGTD